MINDNELLIQYLTAQGHSWPEIEDVIAKLDEYDKRTVHESVFDSIARGTFRLEEVIAEAKDGYRQ